MSDFGATNSYILDPTPPPLSFTIGDVTDAQSFYAAVPINGNKLAIVYCANVIKICKTTQSARNYITKHQKKRKK